MSDENRSGGLAGVLTVLALLGASALGGWYYLSQRGASTVDDGGFDVGATPVSRRAIPVSAPEAAPKSGLELMKVDAELRAETSSSPQPKPAAPAAPGRPTLKDAREDFIMECRRNEDVVRRYAERMTKQSPVILQYGRDWMSHPDLKKLNDDYMRNHDPIAFMQGLAQAPSFPVLLKQYAGKQEILGFIVQGLTKEAPHDLVASGLTLMREDTGLKPVITQVETAVGMTPEMADKLTGGAKKPASN